MAGGNLDDLIAQMKLDDLEGATKLPPIQYAKLRGMYPQKVYTAIRNHRLEATTCECGRKVIVVADADRLFGIQGAEQAVQKAEEA